ncbi:GyrI-like domain-containing protein [uncultured Demequina sp.]|uniref:GyrI-like domain-containing protein n=1 Tax=uncultured Demequina sp. TaxID=693499 RepID=UPI0025F41935|nr:GyrI-like domain-containing protein [uncultured Demequina sp.]
MAEFRIARRGAVTYVGMRVSATMATLSRDVGRGFTELDRYVAQRGIDTTAASLIRYRDVPADGSFTVEVGVEWLGRGDVPRVREPFIVDELPAGHFAVASQRGPYAWIGGLTHELMTWGDERGMDYALEPGDGGPDHWDCRYEWYPEQPAEGPYGAHGPVEVCLLLRA